MKKKMQCTASIQWRLMNTCTIESSIHGYQNEPTQQQLISIYNGIGQRRFTMVKVHLSLDQGSLIISESSTRNKEAYDYMKPQVLYCTTFAEKTQNWRSFHQKTITKNLGTRHCISSIANKPRVVPSNWESLGNWSSNCSKSYIYPRLLGTEDLL